MNKIKLSFRSSQKQNQFFIDQLPMLTFFYERVCIFGSISALIIFSLEFVYPIGFGNSKYLIICLPFIFYISFKLIKKYPNLFNYILPLNNLLIGLLYNINLLFNYIPDLNLMIGQTVVLVQFSLLLGSNFVLNMAIIIFNFSTLILVQTIVQQSFNGNQVMLILALVLSCLSYYSNEYLKREFFLLKQREDVQYSSLIEQFSIQLMKVKYDRRTNFIKLESSNQKQGGFNFSSQEEFRQFIRQIQIPKQQRQTFQSKISSSRLKNDYLQQTSLIRQTRLSYPNLEGSETLEQILYKSFTNQKTENVDILYGYDIVAKCDYKIKILYIIEKGESKAIVLLQQNEVKKQLIKAKQQRDYLKKIIFQFQSLFEIRIKQMSSLLNNNKYLQQGILHSELSFRLVQFISEYFSICINKNDIPKLRISTIDIQSLIQQIEKPIRNYLKLQQIEFTHQIDQNLLVTSDAYLITHLILSLICFLIQKSPIQITLHVSQNRLFKQKMENVDEIIVKLSAQFTVTPPKKAYEIDCFNQMIKKVIKIIGPNEQLVNEYNKNEYGQEITFECVIFKNINSIKEILQKF